MLTAQAIESIACRIMAGLGVGYSEAIYRNALYHQVRVLDPKTTMEQTIPILYQGNFLGVCRADLITSQYVIEIKALKTVLPTVGNQVRMYQKHLHELEPGVERMGMVINFNQHTESVETLLMPPHSSSPMMLPE